MQVYSYRAFIGITGKSYTLTIENNGDYFVIPPKTIKTKDKYEANLNALYEFLELIGKIVKGEVNLCFYCDNFDLNYDWEFIKKSNKVPSRVEHLEEWIKIMKLAKKNNITLKISNKSFLGSIGKVGR